jgi:hypothetical protein
VISTGEQLHAFITANAILRDCKMPKASAWDNLASEIEFLCIVDQQGKAMAAGARHKLQRALEVALESLPGIIEGADRRIELYRSLGWDEKGHITERTKLQTLQRAILAFVPRQPSNIPGFAEWNPELAEKIKKRPCVEITMSPVTQPGARGQKGWHNYGRRLASLFCEVVNSANPGRDLRPESEPASRFLVAIIPEISGERADFPAVKKYLQRGVTPGDITNGNVPGTNRIQMSHP